MAAKLEVNVLNRESVDGGLLLLVKITQIKVTV